MFTSLILSIIWSSPSESVLSKSVIPAKDMEIPVQATPSGETTGSGSESAPSQQAPADTEQKAPSGAEQEAPSSGSGQNAPAPANGQEVPSSGESSSQGSQNSPQ